MISKIKNRLLGKKQSAVSEKVAVEKRGSAAEGYDAAMEAISLAEAGAHEAAQQVTLRHQDARPKILVVGKDDGFAECVMDYAINLAERLNYGIIAMNVNTVAGHTGKFLSPFKKHLHEEFVKRANDAAEILRGKAQAREIPCEHVVKYGDVGKAVEDLHHEVKRIEFVITEPEVTQDESGAEVTIPVFSMNC